MATPTVAPFGAWRSPITSELIVSRALGIGQVALDGNDIYWLESRPLEGGRGVVVRRTAEGTIADVTPPSFNVRTTVHEYGGGAFAVADGVVYFANFADQRLYRQVPGEAPALLTPETLLRYADGVVDSRRGRSIWVRESHAAPGQAKNSIVSVRLAGGDTGLVLVASHDFYASPRLSPNGSRLAWLAWNHPNMPWDGCELWVADVTDDGFLVDAVRVAGGENESIFQPEWSPEGVLHFVSDRTGWWNLYRWRGGRVEPLAPMEAEFGLPQWVFGMSTYAFAAADKIVCTYLVEGRGNLGLLDTREGKLTPVQTPYTDFGSNLRAAPGFAVFSAGSPTEPSRLVRYDIATGDFTELRRSTDLAVDPGYLSIPQVIAFPTTEGRTAYGFFYPPQNRDSVVPAGERPPLIVKSHGGPTSATGTALQLSTQYWTSRGFAVLDVNYGGSTGYGRAYRERLDGQWGIVDVDDCVNGARYLAEQGLVDRNRLAITGGSAGGYTTLAALTFRDAFKAGSSHYGVSDLEALALDTHKFESRYLDRLVGPYPARRDLYLERSPIHHVERLATPTIFFQGLEDKVVPPAQAEAMVAALRAKGVPVAYLPFPGEQHGFRRAENIKRTLDAELFFYGRIFGFTPADAMQPVPIENL